MISETIPVSLYLW